MFICLLLETGVVVCVVVCVEHSDSVPRAPNRRRPQRALGESPGRASGGRLFSAGPWIPQDFDPGLRSPGALHWTVPVLDPSHVTVTTALVVTVRFL